MIEARIAFLNSENVADFERRIRAFAVPAQNLSLPKTIGRCRSQDWVAADWSHFDNIAIGIGFGMNPDLALDMRDFSHLWINGLSTMNPLEYRLLSKKSRA